MGRTAGTEACNRGLHGMSLTVYTPLGTEGWDGQLGQRPVVRDSMGCPSLSIHPSVSKRRTDSEGTSHGVPSVGRVKDWDQTYKS